MTEPTITRDAEPPREPEPTDPCTCAGDACDEYDPDEYPEGCRHCAALPSFAPCPHDARGETHGPAPLPPGDDEPPQNWVERGPIDAHLRATRTVEDTQAERMDALAESTARIAHTHRMARLAAALDDVDPSDVPTETPWAGDPVWTTIVERTNDDDAPSGKGMNDTHRPLPPVNGWQVEQYDPERPPRLTWINDAHDDPLISTVIDIDTLMNEAEASNPDGDVPALAEKALSDLCDIVRKAGRHLAVVQGAPRGSERGFLRASQCSHDPNGCGACGTWAAPVLP